MDPYLQHEAKIVKRIQESSDIFTFQLNFTDPEVSKAYAFKPGQFNMLYLFGGGEVAISIVSDPNDPGLFSHSIRAVGRVTEALAALKEGDSIGVRGPFGKGWPMETAKKKDVIFVTGGIGCAPVVAAINYALKRRDEYGKIKVLQGVKHPDDFIFAKRYEEWMKHSETEVILSADKSDPAWPWNVGFVTEHIKELDIDPKNAVGMICGPEMMMNVAAKALEARGLSDADIYVSMERSMHCGVGHCGHCQCGGVFVCKDGPVFTFKEVKPLFGKLGF